MPELNLEPSEATTEILGSRLACAVKLPTFEGPLDLLLHLIRTNEVDINDIPIAMISAQYLEYLDVMRELDIDVAAEYLLMAATLAYIKSRMLLPPDADTGEDEGEDPRAELARRLAEYARFKEAAGELELRPQLGRDVFQPAPDLSGVPAKEPVLEVSLFAMLEAMRRVLANLPVEERHHQIELEHLTMQDRMIAVMDQLHSAVEAAILFEDLLGSLVRTRHAMVMTFLAILELARIQALRIFQNLTAQGQPHGPIRVRLAVSEKEEIDV